MNEQHITDDDGGKGEYEYVPSAWRGLVSMRIRLGFADGVQDIVIGELENTPEGIKRYGAHKRWLQHIVADHRRIPPISMTLADLTPEQRKLRAKGRRIQLTDEQVLRSILEYSRRCTYDWAEEVVPTSAEGNPSDRSLVYQGLSDESNGMWYLRSGWEQNGGLDGGTRRIDGGGVGGHRAAAAQP